MGIKVKEPTPGQIEELRQKFNTKYAATPPAVPFHSVDIDRIRNDHVWLQRFLEMHDLDMEVSMTKLWETCTWRQSYGANDLDEKQLNQEYLKEGSIFVHSKDLDGKPLLIFRVKLHSKSKNLDELIRIVVYWVERVQREQHLVQLTIFFDMSGTGLATMDLDFVKRIVETFKMYYPNTLNYILVYELAWVLNAAFKVIKTLLPPRAVEILKMTSKKDINQYIAKDNCLASWGGTDNYEFSFVAETKRNKPQVAAANAGANDEQQQQQQQFAQSQGMDKKVHFANTDTMVLKESNIDDNMHTPSDDEQLAMLQPVPAEFVNFNQQKEATLKLVSTAKTPVSYKIQTTSPDKFRVRPRCGVLDPQEVTEINIWLKQEHTLSEENKDKFLVMAMAIPHKSSKDCNAADIAELWRNKPTSCPDIEQHRLVCRFHGAGVKSCGGAISDDGGNSFVNKVDDGKNAAALKLQAHMTSRTLKLQYVIVALLVLLCALLSVLIYQQGCHDFGSITGSAPKGSAFPCSKRK
ncbi:motile sperm domain-containing protein 2 isoform X1 [Drosophila willistoni]|nr:motile sperm domain-containing protein 2 isoform X1 [Drosophila willistoni]